MSRRKIDLWAPPFSGHLHPVLALARSLQTEYEVRVVSTPGAQHRIALAGVTGVSVMSDADEALLAQVADPPRAVRAHPLRLAAQLRTALGLMARLRAAAAELYREKVDLVIADLTLTAVGYAALQAGIPWWTCHPSPCAIETADGPPGYWGGLFPAVNRFQAAHHALGRAAVRLFKRAVFALHRSAIIPLGLRGPYRADGTEAVYSPLRILALGQQQLEFPRRWPAAVSFVGPQLYTPPLAGAPPFLGGRRHVLFTAGTHVSWHKARLVEAARSFAREHPDVTVHFSDGDLRNSRESDGNFVRAGWIDYGSSLGNYEAVVHHGGTGILYECLARGLPAVVHPADYDQFDNAARLEAAGAAVWVRRLQDLGPAVDGLLSGRTRLPGLAALRADLERTAASKPVLSLVRAQFSAL